jgi:hypothetical protein
VFACIAVTGFVRWDQRGLVTAFSAVEVVCLVAWMLAGWSHISPCQDKTGAACLDALLWFTSGAKALKVPVIVGTWDESCPCYAHEDGGIVALFST